MNDAAQPTRPSLIIQLRDAGNESAWEQFAEIYTPLVFGYCRNRGLQEADASDVVQDVMRAVANAMKKFEYDPDRGRFRSWLLTVTRSKLNNFFRKHKQRPVAEGGTQAMQRLEAIPAPEEPDEWDTLYQRRMFEWAAGKVHKDFKESTWKAFWQTAVDGREAKDVAADLDISVGAVYIARSRVQARLRECIQGVDEDCVTDF